VNRGIMNSFDQVFLDFFQVRDTFSFS